MPFYGAPAAHVWPDCETVNSAGGCFFGTEKGVWQQQVRQEYEVSADGL